MKLAFLILAHKNPHQIARLARALTGEDDYVFIHIDKRATEVNKTADDYLSADPLVYFLSDRFAVDWGSYNQIKATLALLKTAYETEKFDYFFLISGQDIPLKSVAQMKLFLEQHKGKEFLHHSQLPDMEKWKGDNGGLNRMQYFWMNGKLGKYSGYIHLLQKKTGWLRSVNQMNLFGGANWFNLSNKAVSFMLTYLNENPEFLKRFKFTRCADEIFTQTLLMNSPLAANVVNDCLRYVNWVDGPEYPKTLRKEDVEKIFSNPNNLFARKFDETVDKEIIEMIYNKIEE
ncbi:MAG: hypothetical protein IAF38_17745 [Bacteroidia bacterium]|nr:hypothetical protein [Bacteroidia bacterium]